MQSFPFSFLFNTNNSYNQQDSAWLFSISDTWLKCRFHFDHSCKLYHYHCITLGCLTVISPLKYTSLQNTNLQYFASNVFQLLKQVNRFSFLNGEKDWPKNAPLWYSTPQRFLLHHLSPVTCMPSCTQKFEQTCKRTNHIEWSSSRTCINFNHTSKLITT